MSEDSIRHAIEWCARLTGLPRECFEGLSLQDKLDLIGKWFASAVIADHVTLLLVAMAMEEHGLSASDIAKYLGSREATSKPLGHWNFVSGICSVPRLVSRAIKPLLDAGAYRPHLAPDVAAVVCKLLRNPAWGTAGSPSAANVVDAIYVKHLSPYQAKKTMRAVEAFLDSHPEAAVAVLQALTKAREQAVDTISGVDDVEEKVAELEVTLDDEADREGPEETRIPD